MDNMKWEDFAIIDPEFKAFLEKVGPPQKDFDDPTVPTATIRAKQAANPRTSVPGVNVPMTMDGVEKRHIDIPVRDGNSIPALLYQPKSPPNKGSPLIVAYHGGGWCVGKPEKEEVNCAEQAEQSSVNAVLRLGAVSVSVDYRLAPEHPFPTPLNDSWDALRWVASNTSSLRADPSQGFIVHGESAGGNIALVLALLAHSEKLDPPLTGISASIPMLGLSPDAVPEKLRAKVQSYEQNRDAPAMDTQAVRYFVENYDPDISSPVLSLFNWKTGHRDLPPVFFQVCGLDPLRDEALLYEKLLREGGVRTKFEIYPGVPHAFWAFFPDLILSRRAVEKTAEGFVWLLSGGLE